MLRTFLKVLLFSICFPRRRRKCNKIWHREYVFRNAIALEYPKCAQVIRFATPNARRMAALDIMMARFLACSPESRSLNNILKGGAILNSLRDSRPFGTSTPRGFRHSGHEINGSRWHRARRISYSSTPRIPPTHFEASRLSVLGT